MHTLLQAEGSIGGLLLLVFPTPLPHPAACVTHVSLWETMLGQSYGELKLL